MSVVISIDRTFELLLIVKGRYLEITISASVREGRGKGTLVFFKGKVIPT